MLKSGNGVTIFLARVFKTGFYFPRLKPSFFTQKSIKKIMLGHGPREENFICRKYRQNVTSQHQMSQNSLEQKFLILKKSFTFAKKFTLTSPP